jgi:hypothetical protein
MRLVWSHTDEGNVVKTKYLRASLLLVMGAAGVSLLAGCTSGGGDMAVRPTASSTSHPSAQERKAIAAGRAQAEAMEATAQPTAVATDTIQSWPARDHGSRSHASGSSTNRSPGVYTYTVAPQDVASVIALRFGLCSVDVVDPASSTGVLHPGDTLTIERRMTEPDDSAEDQDHSHEGWECNYAG